jgi:3-dehydroquinate synthase
MAEVIKYGLLGNAVFWRDLQQNMPALMRRDKALIIETVHQSCADKADIVAQDEFESGKRALLNLGHTFAHALENTLGYGVYLHGEAVAVGMLMAAKLSALEGFISAEDVKSVENLLQKANLPVAISSKIDYQNFVDAMSVDKKVINGEIRLILMKKLGQAFVSNNYQAHNLEQTIKDFL